MPFPKFSSDFQILPKTYKHDFQDFFHKHFQYRGYKTSSGFYKNCVINRNRGNGPNRL